MRTNGLALGDLSQQFRKHVETVQGNVFGQVHVCDGRERFEDVGRVDQLVRQATGRNVARPLHHHGDAVTAFPCVAFHPTPSSGSVMLVIFTHPNRVHGFGAVVGIEDDERVFIHSQFFQVIEQITGE